MTPPEKSTLGRVAELDALRGLAALSVFIYHTTQSVNRHMGANHPEWRDNPWLSWLFPFQAGEYGVALFFMISGFVIFMTLDRSKTSTDFVVSRLARLYPVFWWALILTAGVRIFVGNDHIALRDFLANITMLPSLANALYVDGVYWTLEVELRFYLIMLLAWRLDWLRQPTLFGLAWVAGAVLVKGLSWAYPSAIWAVIMDALILKHASLFVIGMTCYRIRLHGAQRADLALLVLATGVTVVAGGWLKGSMVLLSAGLMMLVATNRARLLSESRALLYFGAVSYSLYLLHGAIGHHLIKAVSAQSTNVWLAFGVAMGASMVLAHFSHHWIEVPSTRFIRRLYQQHKKNADQRTT